MIMNGYSEGDIPGAPPIHGHGDQGYNTACHLRRPRHPRRAASTATAPGQGQHIDCSMHEALSQHDRGRDAVLALRARRTSSARPAATPPAQRTEPWLVHAKDGKDVILFGVGRDNASWTKLEEVVPGAGLRRCNSTSERFD